MSNFGGIVGCIEKVITDRAVFNYISESFRIAKQYTFTLVLYSVPAFVTSILSS